MSDKFIFFLADNIDTLMSIVAGTIIYYGITNKNSQVTMLGCSLFIVSMMLTIFV